MPRRIAVVAAWVGATLVSILIATAAVGSVRNNVSDTPSPLRSASVTQVIVAASSTSTVPDDGGTTSTAGATTTIGPPETTSSTTSSTLPPAASTTTTAPTPTSTSTSTSTSTTAPSTTSTQATTTTQLPEEEVSTHPLIGGTTTIRTDGNGVYLVAAVPQSGFQVEVEKSGPSKVDVRYRSEDHTSRFKAEWEKGELEVETEESGGSD